jgi:hypothetical protein
VKWLLACLPLLLSLPLLEADGTDRENLLTEDLNEVLAKARDKGLYLHLSFLGSGWSMASDRFDEAVLESSEWKAFTDGRILIAEARARRKPKLTKEETAHLQALVIHFDIETYPTFILLAPDGREVLRHGYRDVSGASYVDLMEALLPGTAAPHR